MIQTSQYHPDSIPKVSVIVNCFNGEKYLRESINSVYNQTCTDWEIILWDNASTDLSPEIAKEYDERLRYFRGEKTIPLYSARNKALEQARGGFIAFLDCDDLWMPDKLEKQIPLFDDPEVGLVFSDAIYFNENGKTKRLYATMPYHTGLCFSVLLSNYFLCLQTVVIRRKILSTEGEWFDPRFNIVGDSDYFRRISYTWRLAMVNKPLAKWRVHSSSMTWTKVQLLFKETNLMLEKYRNIFPDFEKKYHGEIKDLNRQIDIRRALSYIRSGKHSEARRCLSPLKFLNKKVFGLFVLTFLPKRFFITASTFMNIMEP